MRKRIESGFFALVRSDGENKAETLILKKAKAHVAQLVEHVLGKDEVTGSIPVMGSSL